MEQKYYVAKMAPTFLTLTDHKGKLSYHDMVWNLMRMILMSSEELTAEEALKEMGKMPREDFKKLQTDAEAWYADWDFQAYLDREGITLGDELIPVEEVLYDMEDEEEEVSITEQETYERLMERLDEFPMEAFMTWEMPYTEWDHGDNYSGYQ